jgi:hypothetical protein
MGIGARLIIQHSGQRALLMLGGAVAQSWLWTSRMGQAGCCGPGQLLLWGGRHLQLVAIACQHARRRGGPPSVDSGLRVRGRCEAP